MSNVCIPPERVALLKTQISKGEIGTNEIAKMLPEEKAAVKAILEDVVTDRLNVSASPAEVRAISLKAKKIDEAQKKLGEDLGDPTKLKETVDFFKAKKEMDNYLQSHNPAPKLRVATGTIGRGMMLASVKSPILNIGSNIELGITEGLGRRIASKGFRGADNSLARDYIKMVNKVYKETGYDLSRMTQVSDLGANGGRVLDDIVHAQGKGATRKVGRVVEDVVFKQLMGAPDVLSGSLHFADSVNLGALKMSKGNKLKAKELMNDAMRLEPKTPEGQLLRDQGVLDAQVATWTNKTWATEVALGLRKMVNNLSGDARIGDYLFPFVKTPANVVATGLDYAGLGIPKALVKTVKGIRSGELGTKQNMQSISRDLVRSGMGLTAATAFALNIGPDNFMGAYDPNRSQISQLENSNENVVKIGNKWVSTDWFGPLAVPLTGVMYAKKYGKDKKSLAFQYEQGLQSAALQLPVAKDVAGYYENSSRKEGQTSDEAEESVLNYVLSQASSRLVPSIVGDVAKGTDTYQREGNKGLAGIQQKIPGWREKLPAKGNVFGQKEKNEGFMSTLLFGSRVRTDESTPITKEVKKISEANDKALNFTDWNKSNSKELGQFKQKIGQTKFDEAKDKYGKYLENRLKRIINDSDYSKLDDEDKYKVLSDADSEAKKQVYKDYNFKYKKAKTKKLSLIGN